MDQLNRSVSQTSWTDQLSIFEALARLHIVAASESYEGLVSLSAASSWDYKSAEYCWFPRTLKR